MLMGLNHDQFLLMKQGIKTIEIRLNDEKRSFLEVGSLITFVDTKTQEKLNVIVDKIYNFKSFCTLYQCFNGLEVGSSLGDSLEKMVNETYEIYTPKQEEKYGVLAIRISLNSDKIVKSIITNNSDLMNILNIIKNQNLAQGALAAGSIRNTVWQKLHHQPFKLKSDVDVVFFDKNIPEESNREIQHHLKKIAPQYRWEVKNEAYMHNYDFSNQTPFNSVTDAIAHFVETPTCIGAFLDDKNRLQLITPYGTKDMVNLTVQAIPPFKQDNEYLNVYKERLKSKNWQKEWPKLNIII